MMMTACYAWVIPGPMLPPKRRCACILSLRLSGERVLTNPLPWLAPWVVWGRSSCRTGRNLDLGPNVERLPAERQAESTPPKPSHSWNWVGSVWQCSTCLRGRQGRLSVEPFGGVCSLSLRVQPEALRALGHNCLLIDCSDGSYVCICHRCGYHTTGARLAKLSKRCRPEDNHSHNRPRCKLERGLHPSPSKVGVTVDPATVCHIT